MKKRRYICIAIIILAAACILVPTGIGVYQKTLLRKNFTDNQRREPYALNVPLEEMDFTVLKKYFPTESTLLLHNYNRKITLPCDVDYYISKEDSKPALTLKKGTAVYVLNTDEENPVGYGVQCWPDYEKEWRYGYQFLTADFTSIDGEYLSIYYVKSSQLEKVAKAFYKENTKQLQNDYRFSASYYAHRTTQYIDRILYDAGVFCSKQLEK